MDKLPVELDEPAKRIFFEIRGQKAMPFLEIAAATGIRGAQLEEAVTTLAREKLVTVSKPNDLFASIVSISGKYF
jgi:hypothetical protein